MRDVGRPFQRTDRLLSNRGGLLYSIASPLSWTELGKTVQSRLPRIHDHSRSPKFLICFGISRGKPNDFLPSTLTKDSFRLWQKPKTPISKRRCLCLLVLSILNANIDRTLIEIHIDVFFRYPKFCPSLVDRLLGFVVDWYWFESRAR
jgi:hypothetical protein